jgi:hypothetical protein
MTRIAKPRTSGVAGAVIVYLPTRLKREGSFDSSSAQRPLAIQTMEA